MRQQLVQMVFSAEANLEFSVFNKLMFEKYKLVLLLFLLSSLSAHADLDVKINGLSDPLEENVRLHLARWDNLSGSSILEIKEVLQPAIDTGLHALGYYQFEIEYQLKEDELTLSFKLADPVLWGRVDLKVFSNNKPVGEGFQTLIDSHPFKNGERLEHSSYERFKREVLIFANDQGYMDAKLLRNQLRVDVEKKIADVVIHVDIGERYRLADVQYTGTALSSELLDRISEAPVGDWFSASIVGDIYNKLLNSEYFQSVAIDVEKRPPDQTQLTVNLQDLASHRVSTGIGYGTDTSVRGKVRWAVPRINSRGDSINSQLKLSPVEQEITSQYKIPWDHPQNKYIGLDTGWQRKVTEDFEIKKFTTGLSYNRVVNDSWRYSYHIDLENETSIQGDDDAKSGTYLIPGVRWSYRKYTGAASDPIDGFRVWVNFSFSAEALGSDSNFQRLNTGLSTINTFFDRHSVLTRLELGEVRSDRFLDVPPSHRFITGGDQTVRGYDFETISALDSNNKLTGGESLVAAGIEYRYQFAKNWKAAFFVDSGRSAVSDETSKEDSEGLPFLYKGDEFSTGAGVGIRWRSPVGYISVDVATPINNERESGVNFHIYIGAPI